METFFSIIVPIYNSELYLKRCLESIIKQACQAYEVILVDDGSTDTSGDLCDEYVAKFNNFYVIHKNNEGLSSARNTGLKFATGKYIVFLDSDDFIEKELLLKAFTQLEEKQFDACSFGVRRVDTKGVILYEMRFSEFENHIILDSKNRDNFLITKFLQYKLGWEVCFYVFRRDIIEREEIYFSKELIYAEDIPFTFEYLLHVNKVIKIPDILYNYTYRQKSITGRCETNTILNGILVDVYEALNKVMIKNSNIFLEDNILYYAALIKYIVPNVLIDMEFKDIKVFTDSKIKNLVKKKEDILRVFGYKEGRELYKLLITLLQNT